MKSSLEWVTIKLFYTQGSVRLFFYNNAPQSKALTVSNKRKIFPFWQVQTDADACQC